MDEHIIEALGKSKITIKNGKVVEVSEPKVTYCPLFHKYRNIEKIDKKAIEENISFRIKDFGMCTSKRILKMEDYLSFGISEIISTLIEENIIDCAVMVCEGCGTLIITESELVQGIGGRVSGLVKTSPITEIIEKIGKDNIVNPKTAEINQIKGVELAIEKGFKNIAVTIVSSKDFEKLSEIKKANSNVNIYTFLVHTTGLKKDEAEILFNSCDVATSCASKYIRELGDKKSIMSVGESISIYAVTEKGKEFLEIRLAKLNRKNSKKGNKAIPSPLI